MPVNEYEIDRTPNINGKYEVHKNTCIKYMRIVSNELLGEHAS